MPPKPNGPFKRHKTRNRGVSFRERADGSRTYSIFWKAGYVPAGTTEAEALALQATLRSKQARGEKIVINDRTTFGELAKTWLESRESRLRGATSRGYRDTLDLVLLPRFGDWRLTSIDADAISRLVRDLEREGLHCIDPKRPARPLRPESIKNRLKPLRGILGLAVRRGLIPVNPFSHLTDDDRPAREESRGAREWSDEEIAALLQASEMIAKRPTSKYDYTALLTITARLGLRLGEVCGLVWSDFAKDASTLTVARQWSRKDGYQEPKTAAGKRTIPLPDDLRELLIEHRLGSRFSQDADPIFASHSGTPLTHRNVTRRGFEAARDLAEIEDACFHDLRDAAPSRMLAAGIDPVTVARVVGHRDASVTLSIYAAAYNRARSDDAVRIALAGSGQT